jgi:hypothetical protein
MIVIATVALMSRLPRPPAEHKIFIVWKKKKSIVRRFPTVYVANKTCKAHVTFLCDQLKLGVVNNDPSCANSNRAKMVWYVCFTASMSLDRAYSTRFTTILGSAEGMLIMIEAVQK